MFRSVSTGFIYVQKCVNWFYICSVLCQLVLYMFRIVSTGFPSVMVEQSSRALKRGRKTEVESGVGGKGGGYNEGWEEKGDGCVQEGEEEN
jgi:hypothetical protein